MGDTWIIDLQHYLEDGDLVPGIPTAALNIALHMGAIVAWMTAHGQPTAAGIERTNVPCRRSPGRTRCTAEIEAAFDSPDGGIIWRCPACGDNGLISGWQGTGWDRRRPAVAGDDQAPGARPAMRLIKGFGGSRRTKIDETTQVPVRLRDRDRRLLDEVVFDPDYVERLRPAAPGSTDVIGDFTLDDIEDMLGSIATEANHTESSRLRDELDNLYDRLVSIQRSYDDGRWNDSGD